MIEEEIIDFLRSKESEMVALLTEWCRINSGSWNDDGLLRMKERLLASLEMLPGSSSVVEGEPFCLELGEQSFPARSLISRKKKEKKSPSSVLLNGHMDTVYGMDHPFQEVNTKEGRMHAPGCADMKGGLVVLLYGLLAYESLKIDRKLSWEVLITQDEEIGSYSSMPELKRAAERNDFGLTFEPALPNGDLIRNRYGVGNFKIQIEGRSAHSGRNMEAGINAIVCAADLVKSLHDLNIKYSGVISNVASIQGGEVLNMVPDQASLCFMIRVKDYDWMKKVLSELEILIREVETHRNCKIEWTGGFRRPPKIVDRKGEKLLGLIQCAARQFGIPIEWQDTGGASDGNLLSHYGLPNIDNLGVCGGNIHSSQEYTVLKSLVERAAITALTLVKIGNEPLRT